MFPSVNRQDSLNYKIKERQWDDRLGPKSSIPQYSPLKDKHTKSYRKLITHKKQEQEIESRPQKSTYFQKRLELVEELNQIHKSNQKLIEEYQELAGKYRLPNWYIYYTLLPLKLPATSITQYIFKEKKEMKEQTSYYHRISTAVKAREECLERLRKTLSGMSEDKLEGAGNELREEVQHLRFLTENVIDEIKKWRDSLGKIEDRAVFYSDNQQNYLIKILNDNRFIFSSMLASALSFGQKNDPFLLVPVKRELGKDEKQASMFSNIVALTKDYNNYLKYMEYLAGEKAHELAANPPARHDKGYRNPVVEKVYKSNHSKLENTPQRQGEEDDYKKMEMMKVREDRLKKNEEKIKSIKSIYEHYGKKSELKTERNYRSEKKLPETDNEDKRGQRKRIHSIKRARHESSDVQFESLVKMRLQAQKSDRKDKSKTPMKKSATNFNKSEDKMIQSLRDIQSTLRSKLQVIQQEDKLQNKNESVMSSQQKFNKKSNEEIVKELKAQILSKIEKQAAEKEKTKRLRRQQEEKALEQIKMKLKKEMEQKLQQKKKQKMLQRQELEKKLKEEEERLNSQRQLQLQLQLKLTKQKQLRELEKIRRQALEREKKFKEELDKEQKLRKQREEDIERQRKEKQKLLEQLKKRQLKQQIQDQLRKQLKPSRKGEEANDLNERELIRAQKQSELSKQIQYLKMKEGVEMEQLKRQNEMRGRMLKLRREEEQLKRKEIEHLMRQAVQREKQDIEQDAMKQRVQLQERMRANVKEKMLDQYKNQKEAQIEQIRHERERQLQQEVYREKIRDKIQKQMRIEAIQRTKKELDDRESKKMEVRSKLEQVKSRFDKEIVFDKGKIQEDVKKQMVEKVILDKQAQKEAAKYDLRLQFEKELLASAIPQLYENKDSFMLKNIDYYQGDIHLQSKMEELKPTNQKPVQSPKKIPQKGDVKPIINNMTLQQLEIYGKQKQKVSQIKQQKIIVPARVPEEEEGFERLNIDRTHKEDEGFQVKVVKVKETAKKEKKQKGRQSSRKKKKKVSSEEADSEDEVKLRKSPKKKKRHYYDSESQDSEEVQRKRKKQKRKRKISSEEQPSSQEELPKISPKKLSKQFRSEQEIKQSKPVKSTLKQSPVKSTVKQSKPLERKQSEKEAVVYFDAQKSNKFKQIDPITIKPQKVSNTAEKFKIALEAVPEADFDQHLQVHLSTVTPVQLAIQLFNRQELYRKLIGQLTFCLLIGQHEGRVIGQAIAYHDRTRSDLRKFTIVHIATYDNENLRDFILSVTNYIFRKDPCDEIEFHYKFDESEEDQLQFSQGFNKWFDKYGSVYQKKADDTVFERKYLLKRQFNQKCQVVLGGVNKNIFRNLFSVYCGVLMSDTDMLQFKEELIDSLSPENQISYSLMVSELFRTYLSPDEAESLKNSVRQFVKLKEMLILVVSMQKKKLKLDELKLYEYKNLIELNMRLMSQGKDIIRYCKDSNAALNRIYYAQLNQAFNLPFHFQTTSLPVQAGNQGQIRQISYFRLSPLPPFKLHIIKSSLYNAQMNILPTENSKYKIFIMNAQQYNEIKDANHIDLFMYIRLFLKNVKSHNVAVWKYVWLPQMTDKGAWNLREFRSFLNKDFYTHDQINISYRQFLPGALIIEPEHRDLVITPPFIVGVMSMSLQQISQGSPLYARMIELNALKTIEVQQP